MSSPYAVVAGRSLDQWKVTELKEELKKRKLTIKGLKEDLVKRLDEAIRIEWDESAKDDEDNGLSNPTQSELPSKQETTEPFVSENANDLMDIGIGSMEKGEGKPKDEIDDQSGSQSEHQVVEADLVQENHISQTEGKQDTNLPGYEATVVVSETVDSFTALSGSHVDNDKIDEVRNITAGLENGIAEPPQEDAKHEHADQITDPPETNQTSVASPSGPGIKDSETQIELSGSAIHLANADSNVLQSDSDVLPLEHQVSEADPNLRFEVVSDSVSIETVSIIEKNDIKVDVITDNVKLEVRHEMVQPSLAGVGPNGGESHLMDVEEHLDTKDVEEPLENKVSMEDTAGNNLENSDGLKNIDSEDIFRAEKLSLDRSSGDDSMEEDIVESKEMQQKSHSNETIDDVEKFEMTILKEEGDVDVVGVDKPVEAKEDSAGNKSVTGLQSGKRKFDKEAVGDNETTKRARRWNTESLKSSESERVNISTTPKDSSQPTVKRFSRSDSVVNEESPKERVVPPSSKAPSNSLRIDQFLRPFTLKAVQELLGKTGSVTSFWMDHIKTHCYVSYSSVEEAVETRNAVYNLQWPPNGGRLLVAEFVDPQEVKTHIEPPPATPSSGSGPSFSAQPPPTRQPLLSPRQQLPPPSLPPPPPAREQLPARELLNLPPPPPLPEKVEPPIVTLDDLFKKTKAIPRIYYLPLSDEQVAAKLKSQKNVNQ